MLLLHNLRKISTEFCQVKARSAQSTSRRRCHLLLLRLLLSYFYASSFSLLNRLNRLNQYDGFTNTCSKAVYYRSIPESSTTTPGAGAAASRAHNSRGSLSDGHFPINMRRLLRNMERASEGFRWRRFDQVNQRALNIITAAPKAPTPPSFQTNMLDSSLFLGWPGQSTQLGATSKSYSCTSQST